MPCACRQPGPCSSATRGRVTCRAGSGSLPPRALMISEHSFKFLVGFMSSLLFKEDFLPLVCQKRENEQQLSCVRTTPVSHSVACPSLSLQERSPRASAHRTWPERRLPERPLPRADIPTRLRRDTPSSRAALAQAAPARAPGRRRLGCPQPCFCRSPGRPGSPPAPPRGAASLHPDPPASRRPAPTSGLCLLTASTPTRSSAPTRPPRFSQDELDHVVPHVTSIDGASSF